MRKRQNLGLVDEFEAGLATIYHDAMTTYLATGKVTNLYSKCLKDIFNTRKPDMTKVQRYLNTHFPETSNSELPIPSPEILPDNVKPFRRRETR